MRTSIARLSMALGAVTLLGLGLHAQSYQAKASIPFSFQTAGTVLSAGSYYFENQGSRSYTTLRNMKTGRMLFVTTGPVATAAKQNGRIIFHRYGNEYFLAGIWALDGTGTDVSPCKREKELKLGSRPLEASVVSIALRAD